MTQAEISGQKSKEFAIARLHPVELSMVVATVIVLLNLLRLNTKVCIHYTSVPYDIAELNTIIADIDADLSVKSLSDECIITARDVHDAIIKLKSHKKDGSVGLSSDHFINASADLSVHIAFLFSAIISHGCVPRDFSTSTIIPIPKKRNVNATDSENYRGISLSSVFGKIFDNIVLCKYYDKLCTSDLQFGFNPPIASVFLHANYAIGGLELPPRCISSSRADRNEIPAATPMFSGSNFLMVVSPIL